MLIRKTVLTKFWHLLDDKLNTILGVVKLVFALLLVCQIAILKVVVDSSFMQIVFPKRC